MTLKILALALLSLFPCFPRAIPGRAAMLKGALVYIEPMPGGVDGLLAAEIVRLNVPLVLTGSRNSVGIGYYRLDLHPSTGGDNYIDIDSLPFQIPMGALIPKRTDNLLPACKNLGTTHITNGCYRLHPVEWNIGEASGAIAAEAIRLGETPRAIRNSAEKLPDLQSLLRKQGFALNWPG